MFALGSQSASICLRCQLRLAHSLALRPKPKLLSRFKTPVRAHSAAVAQVQEEEEEDEVEEVNSGYHAHQDESSKRAYGSSKKPKHHKRIKIAPVAELGVPALGQPAEVLVLQPRDRSIPKVPICEENNTKQYLLESLEAENRPLNPEQVKQNIEQIRAPFGIQGGPLTEPDWQSLRKKLVNGFTYKQLARYIKDAEQESVARQSPGTVTTHISSGILPHSTVLTKKEVRSHRHRSLKSQASFHILLDIWGFSIEGAAASEKNISSLDLKITPHRLDVLLAQREQPLKQLANRLQLQIDLFREKRKVVITGTSGATEEAKEALHLLLKGITESRITLGKSKRLFPQEDDLKWEEAFRQSIARSHNIVINRAAHGTSLRLLYHTNNQEDGFAARRQLLLAAQRTSAKPEVHVWTSNGVKSPLQLIKFPIYEDSNWLDKKRSWGRWAARLGAPKELADEPTPKDTDMPGQELIGSIHSTLQKSNLSQDFLLPREKSVVVENVSIFGQALFNPNVSKNLKDTMKHDRQSSPAWSGSRMITDVPLLTQFLAMQSRCSINPKNLAKGTNNQHFSSNPQFHYRLTLIPSPEIQTLNGQPPIEVNLIGQDIKAGLRQPLQVRDITALLEERSHLLLLPESVVDITFRRRRRLILWAPGHKTRPENSALLSQLLKYFNLAQGQDSPSFSPFVRLTISKNLAERLEAKPKTSPPAPKVIDPRSVKKQLNKLVDNNRGDLITQYMLAVGEVVDSMSYTNASYQSFFLNHIQLTGDKWNGDRRLLQLGEHADLQADMTGRKSTDFTKFFGAAYGLATKLGDTKLMRAPG